MPAFETMDLTQDAVLWAKTGADEYNVTLVSSAVGIKCRWVNKRREVVDAKGNTIATDAQVVVCADIPVGSILWEGCIDDIAGTGSDPAPTGGLMSVITSDRATDIKGRVTRRTLNLMRYNDVLRVA